MRKLLLTIGLCLWPTSYAAAQTQPDIVVMLSDDQGIGSVTENVYTPKIDSIGKQGIKFTDAYAQPACIPARAAMYIGQWPQRRSMGNSQGNGPFMPANKTTFVDKLKDNGYRTSLVGKWHEGATSALNPLARGFDTAFWFRGAPSPHYIGPDSRSPLFDQLRQVANPAGTLLGDTFAKRAVDILSAPRTQPLLLVVAWNGLHDPLEGETVQTRLRQLDKQVGRVLAATKPNTLVIFMGDNGRDSNSPRPNRPWRGKKFQILEGGVRVPALVRWPGHIPSGQIIHTPVSILDIAPTVSAAAGAPMEPTDGMSWLDINPNRFVYLDAFDSDPGKTVNGAEPGKGIRKGEYVYYHNYLGIEHQLYKPSVDKSLSYNLQGNSAELRDEMLEILNGVAPILAD